MQLRLEEEIRGMLQSGGWSQLFSYYEQSYKDNTIEVLSTFEVDKGFVGFDRAGSIRFQLFKERQRLSFTNFSLMSRLYDTDFTSTPKYENLLIDFPLKVTP